MWSMSMQSRWFVHIVPFMSIRSSMALYVDNDIHLARLHLVFICSGSGQGLAFIIAGGSIVQKNLEVRMRRAVFGISCFNFWKFAVSLCYCCYIDNITEILKLVRRLYRLILDSAKERENIDGCTIFCFC